MMKGNDRYRVAGLSCTIDGRCLPVANLSVGGFFVETEEPMAVGQVVTAELRLQGVAFEITARVAWINSAARPRVVHLPAGFGLKIQRIPFAARMEIVRILGASGGNGKRRPQEEPAA